MADASVTVRDAETKGQRDGRAPVLQWVGFFLPPAAFFAHLQIDYVLVPYGCATGQHVWHHVVGVLAVILSAVGGVISAIVWRRSESAAADDAPGAIPRSRFIGLLGVGQSVLLTLILLAQWLAGFVISPCQ